MGLEVANYINQLNPSNPLSTDGLGQADDHIRLIKAVLKNTFPNITGPVTVTQQQLNSPIPIGFIGLWYGSEASVPEGWAICDGRTVSRTDGGGNITTPDLRNRVPMGASPTRAVGSTGGSTSYTTGEGGAINVTAGTTSAGFHSHGGATHAHALTVAQIPSHGHLVATDGDGGTYIKVDNNLFGNVFAYSLTLGGNGAGRNLYTGPIGGGEAHSHGITADGAHSHIVTITAPAHTHSITNVLPPYMAFHYIMKV